MQRLIRVYLLVAALVAGAAQANAAITFDFESPTYADGLGMVGQDGWVQNSYVGPSNFLELNGEVTSSSNAPLVGAQSLFYNETSLAGGNGGGADMSKANVITIVRDGTSAVDLNASVRMQADANSVRAGQLGFFLSFDGFNGFSPIYVLLNDVNSSIGTGRIEIFHTGGVTNVAPYTTGNQLEFQLGVNFDGTQDYSVAVRDVTAGEAAFTPLPGPLAGGRFGFFASNNAFPHDGDGVSYTVDIGAILRGGTGRIDQITLAQVPEPASCLLMLGVAMVSCLRHSRNR